MKQTFIAAITLVLLSAAPALAQNGDMQSIMNNVTSLTNAIGKTSKTDNTGSLLNAKLMQGLGSSSSALLQNNSDGTISKKQMNTFNGRLFDMADTNRDGKLTADELETYATLAQKAFTAAGVH